MIFISTGGYSQRTAFESALELMESGITGLELSGGRYSAGLHDDLAGIKDKACLQIHNYFPPSETPFVFNLASPNPAVEALAMAHAKLAISWAADFSRPIYSFHAGFLMDPQPAELGRQIGRRVLMDRREGMNRFIGRVCELAAFARERGVELLVENNVLSPFNFKEFGDNPFLAATADEAIQVMENTPDNVNMLMDVAHLKVSAQTLGFDPVQMLKACDPWIKAYHLSDNDGLSDSNDMIGEDSWFWPHLKQDLDYYSLEIYRVSVDTLKQQLALARSKLGK